MEFGSLDPSIVSFQSVQTSDLATFVDGTRVNSDCEGPMINSLALEVTPADKQ